MSKTYVGIKLQDLGLYNTLDPKDKIVIVKDKDEGVLQLKDFFLYVQSNLDLSNYYTSTQADTIFMAKVDAYTRKDADLKFALVEKTYTRLQSDSRFALAADTFNKTEIEEKYASKEQMYTKDLVYTKDEAITAFALKTEIPILPDLTPYSTTAKGDLRWALKVDVFSKTEADARFANINNYYTKTESDNKYALLSNTYTKAETDNKFLDTTEAYTKDYINLNIYTKTQVYTKAETDGKYPLKTDVYTVTAVNDQFAAKSWVYSRAEADNTFRKLADSYNRAEVNALIDASKSGLSTDVSNTYYTKTDTDAKFELKGTAYNKIDSDAKYALISNSISSSQVAAKYYNKTEIDKSFGDAATNTSNLFALKTAAVGGISLTPTNLTFTKVDGTSSLVAIPTWNQSTTGNAATATRLQTDRNFYLTNAASSNVVSFNGSGDVAMNVTSLDATKLSGIVPQNSISGIYRNISLDTTGGYLLSKGSNNSVTAYGLGSFRNEGNRPIVVIKTTVGYNDSTVYNITIEGNTDAESNFVKLGIMGFTSNTKINKINLGGVDILVRKAKSADGFLCFILGDVGSSLGLSFSFSITTAAFNFNVKDEYLKGWTFYNATDLTGLSNISDFAVNNISTVSSRWDNIVNKPTTVSGYGITDAYTKTDVYTKAEADAKFSYKLESIKSATLSTTTLAFTKADNTVSNLTIPTWNQSTTGNAATATKLQTTRTINGVAFDGTTDIVTPATGTVIATDDRAMVPNDLPLRSLGVYFTSKGGLETTTANASYGDFLALNTYVDSSGGGVNGLFFAKGVQAIYHYYAPFGSTNPFPTPKQIAYTDSDITGNAATASKWQTARNIGITGDATWSVSVNGGSNVTGAITLANTGVSAGTYTKITVDSKGRAVSGSNLLPADIPNLDMSKVNTGVLGINQGGTGATTAATARTNLGLGTSAVLNVGAVNGVASLDASGKVPTGQLYINNTLTSTDTTVPLTAAQGKVLNDSLGVTNSNLQSLTNRLDTNYYLKSDVFTKTEITTNYFDKTYVNNNFLAQAANKDVSIAGFINAAKDILFTTSLTGIKWNMNTDIASIYFKNNGDDDSDSYLGFDVGDNGDEYFRWSFNASSSNKIAMSLRRDKLEINNSVATLGLSTSASLTDISKIPQYGIYSKGNIKTDGQIITNATSHHVNISDLAVGNDSPIRIPEYSIPMGQTGYIPFIHGSVLTNTNGYTMHSSLGLYRANNTWWDGGMYMAIGGDDRYPTAAFRFKLDGTIDFTGGSVNLVGNASSATKLQTARTISLTGDGSWSTSFDGTGNSTGSFVLTNSGVTAGTYTKVTVDSKGRVTSGTSLVAGDIPTLDTGKLTSGILPIARGGTGAGDAVTARNNLGLTPAATTPITTDVYTGTVGNVMRVGDFGIGSDTLQQKKAGSYNDLTKTGFYTINVADNAPPVPTAGDGTWLNGIVLSHRSNYTTQLFSQFTNNGDIPYTYLRTQYNGTWNKWYRLAIEGIDASFTSLQMTRPSSHISAPNVFIDTDGVLKKTSFAFGSAATKNVGTSDGDLMAVGSFGWGSSVSPLYGEDVKSYQIASGFFRYQDNTVNRPPKTGQYDVFGLRFPRHRMGFGGSLWLPYAVSDNKQIVYETNYGDQSVYHYIYTDQNTPNADITVNSLTVKNLTGTTDNAPNLYYHTDGKFYKANQPALLKSQADTLYSPINLTKLYAPDTRSNGHVKPNTIPVKALSVAFADMNASFGINNGYPWGDVIVLNTWEEPSGGNPNAIITSRGGSQGIWHAYGPFNGSAWSSVKQIAYTDSNITGNADTATKFQTARNIGITGAVTAAGISFDGTSNVNINATSLDATKLSGSIPNANINGLYSNITLDISNGSMYSRRGNSLTAYGLGSIRNSGPGSNTTIVIKTPIPSDRDIVFGMNLTGVTDSENSIIDITIVGWNRGNIAKLSLGTKDYDVRKATSSDGFLCFLISHPSGALGLSTAFSITSVHLNSDTNPNYLTNWTLSITTDLSTFTNISNPFPHTTSTVKPDWINIQSKPTTVSGYGITDVYTKSQTYTQADCDYLYFRKSQTWNRDDMDYRFINADGDTLRGNLHFYGGGWNNVGDDAAFGDVNLSGLIGIRSLNNADRVGFALYNTNNVFVNELSYYGGGFHSSSGFTAPYLSVNNGSGGRGISLHEMQYSGMPNYGLCFSEISTFGGYGDVNGDWATYFNVIGGANRGWIFTNGGNVGHAASISARGNGFFRGWLQSNHLININGGYYSDNRHSFLTNSGNAQYLNTGGLLVSDTYNDSVNVSASGIWAKGDIKSALSVYAGANVYVGNNVQFSTTGTGIRWDMNTDFGRIYFKNDGNADTNSYLGFEVGDDNTEHFKWFVSTAEVMTLRNTGLAVNTIGISNTRPDTGLGISLYGGNSFGQPSHGLFFGGTSTFGVHGDTSADWATYFTMSGGSNRGWIFRSHDNGNVASISARGHAHFSYIHSHGSMYSASEFTTGSYIYAGGYVNTDRLLNRSGTHWSDNRHNFYVHSSGSAQGMSIANLLVSDDYGQVGNVPSNGIWAKGDIKTNAWLYAGGEVRAGTNIQAGGNITAQGDVTAFSDKRLKENIESINDALSKVKQLNGVTYTRNDLEDKEQRYIGLLAQDVTEVFPEAVRENENGILSLNYSGLIGGLVEAIKELDNKNQALEARLARLEELIK